MSIRVRNIFEKVSRAANIKSMGNSAITFINQGTNLAVINNIVKLAPGQSFSINQVSIEAEDFTNYEVFFDEKPSGINDLAIIKVGVLNY